jgi:O-antigen/teichoic acid export membrane protein
MVYSVHLVKLLPKSILFRASGIYKSTSIVNGAIPCQLLPILTRFLTPSEYGIVSMSFILVSISGDLIGLSVHGSLNRGYFIKEIELRKYVFNCFVVLCISLVVIGISFIFLL